MKPYYSYTFDESAGLDNGLNWITPEDNITHESAYSISNRCRSVSETSKALGSSSHHTKGSWNSIGLEDVFQSPKGRKKHSARKSITHRPINNRYNDLDGMSAAFPSEISIYAEHDEGLCYSRNDSALQRQRRLSLSQVGQAEELASELSKSSSLANCSQQSANTNADDDINLSKSVDDKKKQLEDTSNCECTADLTCSTDLEQSYTDYFRPYQHHDSISLNAIREFQPCPQMPPPEDLIEILSLSTVSDNVECPGERLLPDRQRGDADRNNRRRTRRLLNGVPPHDAPRDTENSRRRARQSPTNTKRCSRRHKKLLQKLENFIEATPNSKHTGRSGRSVSGRSRSTAITVASATTLNGNQPDSSARKSRQSSGQSHKRRNRRQVSDRHTMAKTNVGVEKVVESRARTRGRSRNPSARSANCRTPDDSTSTLRQRDRHSRSSTSSLHRRVRRESVDPDQALRSMKHMEGIIAGTSDYASSPDHRRRDSHNNGKAKASLELQFDRHRSSSPSSRRSHRLHHLPSSDKSNVMVPGTRSFNYSKSSRDEGIVGFLELAQSGTNEFNTKCGDIDSGHKRDIDDILQAAGITVQQIAVLHKHGLNILPDNK